MLDIRLMTAEEIADELGSRLRTHRLQLRVTQQELAARAGVNVNTVRTLEARPGASSLQTVIRVARALGLSGHFESVFIEKPKSIPQMARNADAPRQRARRKRSS